MNGHSTSDTNGDSANHFTARNGNVVATCDHPGRDLSVRFDRGPSAASAARNALLVLDTRVDAQCLDDIRLLVSELVTNAVRHAGGPRGGEVTLDVTIESSSLHVEVTDPGTGFDPQPRDDEMSRPGGWGLYLVDRIADRWGVVRNHLNHVWFEIDGVAV
jgi:anti-sigma regulatory factor (Ser/Thr protein kinase)